MSRDSNKIHEAVTDNYGDFKFDHLEENSGTYTVEIRYQDHETRTLKVDLKKSLNLGTTFLKDSAS